MIIPPHFFDSGTMGVAHCAICNMWLSPTEGCLHIKPIDYGVDRLADRDGLAKVSAPFHRPT